MYSEALPVIDSGNENLINACPSARPAIAAIVPRYMRAIKADHTPGPKNTSNNNFQIRAISLQ